MKYNTYECAIVMLLEAILKGISLIIRNQCKDKDLISSFQKYTESTIKLSKIFTERN